MLISIKYTPNPNSIQVFVDIVWIDIFWECKDEFTSQKSPLTKAIWQIDGVCYILVGPKFLIINKKNENDWNQIIPKVQNIVSNFIMTENHVFPLSQEQYDEILNNYDSKKNKTKRRDELSDLGKKIWDIVEEKIKPGLELHGGGIEFISLENYKLVLRLTGACVGCPSSSDTIDIGIKQILTYFFPELVSIVCES
ncbi:NifU family protein [Alphaproteobacteria bacterium endosymbiont of Tiliacea citrago]|uniref:NifU family protein n=1 Tax=Alphaproteobacteria bacterium endosymbiont of Tiliacea citrago TaxID=3077944 RepID=UPI00313B6506